MKDTVKTKPNKCQVKVQLKSKSTTELNLMILNKSIILKMKSTTEKYNTQKKSTTENRFRPIAFISSVIVSVLSVLFILAIVVFDCGFKFTHDICV